MNTLSRSRRILNVLKKLFIPCFTDTLACRAHASMADTELCQVTTRPTPYFSYY